MWVNYDFKDIDLSRPSGVTIGAFDGVHRGHRALIRQMVKGAERRDLVPVVITFDPLPRQALNRGETGLLTTLEERIMRIATLGVEGVVVLRFDEALRNTTAQAFVQQMIDQLALKGLWIGPDFRLGRDRQGDVTYLRHAGKAMGFDVHILRQTVTWQGRPVRSSRIRRALKEGRIQEANGCLGYPYQLSGEVVQGDRRGRILGFPTANLRLPQELLLPENGVYICRAHLRNGSYNALTNVGTRPTFNGDQPSVEAYLLDFADDLYGAHLKLDFLARLRPELRFSSAEALIAQMQQDEANARAWLKSHDRRQPGSDQ